MRMWKNLSISFALAGALAASAAAQSPANGQAQPPATSGTVTTVNQAIDRIIAREHD